MNEQADKTVYCLGYPMSKNGQDVLLMLKNRPHFLAGQWNGIGGKVEGDESALDAMMRECEEETGLKIENWSLLRSVEYPTATVHVYTAFADIHKAKTVTDEEVSTVSLCDMKHLPLSDISARVRLDLTILVSMM